MNDNRPDPDALLASVKESEARRTQGFLKVYLGMSAGVGKTYSMLSDAIGERKRGSDVVAGYIEPHGRKETEELAEQLEILPKRKLEYRGVQLQEFDLDSALIRKPGIVLVDELAHSNATGSRHEKRWQDVQELLSAGISVWTTVNVQHLESLNDVIARITGVEVKETVPDSVLMRADEVELVDIPPDELLERLREGKIYSPDKIPQALGSFFRKGNLIALRELVLRHTAERVDAQLRRYKDQHGVHEIWATTERILVCVAPNALSARVVRTAGRLAATLHAELIAVSIESLRYAGLSGGQRSHAAEALRVAESFGALTVVRSAEDIVGEILGIARERNVTSIVVGKPLQPRWREYVFGSVVDELIRRSGEINIHVVPGGKSERTPVKHAPRANEMSARGMLGAVAVTAISTVVGWLMSPRFDGSNIIMVYLLGVTWVASRYSRGVAIWSTILSIIAFDFFFVPPEFTFAVSDAQYLVTFVVMLVVGLLISSLTLRVRAQTELVSERERRTAALYEVARKLADAKTENEAAEVARSKFEEILKVETAILLPADGQLQIAAGSTGGFEKESNEFAVARWVYERGEIAGTGTPTLSGSRGLYLPLRGSQGVVGVLALRSDYKELPRGDQELCFALGDQIALAFERMSLKEDSTQAQILNEKERMRNALLSSVSHDLRTPLASIGGAASAMLMNKSMSEDARIELATSIGEEANRLGRILRNVLDVTRLESGSIELQSEWNSIEELVGAALSQVEPLLEMREVKVNISSDVPLMKVDGMLLQQLLVNLFENAVKFSPPDSPLEVAASSTPEHVLISVADRGRGIVPGEEEKIFDRLYRSPSTGAEGFGLGLSICRAIAQAHGGRIFAENRHEGGALFQVELPRGAASPEVPSG